MATQPGILPLSLSRGIEFDSIILHCRDENAAVTTATALVPNAVGLYVPTRLSPVYQLYILLGAPSYFLYFNDVAASYVISGTLTTGALTDYWSPAAPLTEPTGTYLPHGAYTGTAIVSDNPVDLTGYTAEAQVRRNNRSSVVLDLAPVITDDEGGEITIPAIPTAVTKLIESFGDFNWDLVLRKTSTGERIPPILKGPFTISDTVTQHDTSVPQL